MNKPFMMTVVVFGFGLAMACASVPSASCQRPSPAGNQDLPTEGAQVCCHLAAIGCSDGQAANCAVTFDNVQSEGLTDLKPACLLAATSVDQARDCGTVLCK
jgi:hypothetical protein